MLVVSDLLGVARGDIPARRLLRSSPQRFGGEVRAPVIVWNVCRHCDMSCPHCYAAASRKRSSEDLGTNEAKEMLADLHATGVRIVIFSGGEPLLREDLIELIEYAHGLGIACHLSSNGVHIDAVTAAKLAAAGIGYVGVSIDGMPEFNDAYRALDDAHARALAGLREAKQAGLRTGLRITVTRRNREHVDPLIDICSEHGIDRFYLSHLVYAGRARSMMTDDLSPAQARAALLTLFDRADALLDDPRAGPGIVTGGNDSAGPLLCQWVERRYGAPAADEVRSLLEARGGNSAGEGVMNIDHRGRVHPDQFWRNATVGDLRRESFASVLKHPLLGELRSRERRLEGRCGRCVHVKTCRGSHRERALTATGNLWGPDPACVLELPEVLARSVADIAGESASEPDIVDLSTPETTANG
jgi:radical SAM protein with 4Fe4S-binding SPASM domain